MSRNIFETPPLHICSVESMKWTEGAPMDLTAHSVAEVLAFMGDPEPQQCELFCSRGLFSVAREIWAKLGIAVVLVPGEILKYPSCWAVRGPELIIYMEVPH